MEKNASLETNAKGKQINASLMTRGRKDKRSQQFHLDKRTRKPNV